MNKLNFGCGFREKEGYDNVDKKDFDFNIFPYPILKNTYNKVYSHQVLEHLDDPERVLNELHRICKHNAEIEIIVPHFNNEGAFSMLGHKRYFAESSFKCLTEWNEEWRESKKVWEIISLEVTPSRFGRFIPKIMRRPLSLLLRGIQKDICVKLRVVKKLV